jgi:hypothetical protein
MGTAGCAVQPAVFEATRIQIPLTVNVYGNQNKNHGPSAEGPEVGLKDGYGDQNKNHGPSAARLKQG